MIPERTLSALKRYVEDHIRPGGFLTAVLENFLFGALFRADPENKEALEEIVFYCFEMLPGGCWGSKEKVDRWCSMAGERKAGTNG